MGAQFRRFKVSGEVKFCVDDIFEESLEAVQKRLENPNILDDDLEAARNHGRFELIISVIEDLGLYDMDAFYAQRDKGPGKTI
jgi:hypothetical protein